MSARRALLPRGVSVSGLASWGRWQWWWWRVVALGEVSTADQAPSVVLAVPRGYDTFNIVFMATGDSQANECFSVATTQWLTTAGPEKNTVYNRAFISTAIRVQTLL